MKLVLFSLFSSAAFFYCFAYTPYNRNACDPDDEVYPCYCKKTRDSIELECRNLIFDFVEDVLEKTKEIKGKKIHLRFWETHFGDIPNDLFKGQNIETLRLENCTIKSFGDKPFKGLENSLKWLRISRSIKKGFTDLKTFPLSHLKKLLSLQILDNDIERVGNDWFTDRMKSLKYLNIVSNNVKELGDRAFVNLPNLEEFWLKGNSFSTVSRSMLPKLLTNLQLLNMDSCGIDRLPEDMFTHMPALEYLMLNNNKIKSLPENTWRSIFFRRRQLRKIQLEGNPLKCDEDMQWIFLNGTLENLYGTCNCETSLCGKKLEELTFDDFE